MEKLKMYQFDDLPAGIQEKFIDKIKRSLKEHRPAYMWATDLDEMVDEVLNSAEFLCMGETSYFMIDIIRDQVN